MYKYIKHISSCFLLSVLVLASCTNPANQSTIVKPLDNKSQINKKHNSKSFNLKNSQCPNWQVRSFNNDNLQSVSVNGQQVFFVDGNGKPYYPYVDSGLIDINQYLILGNNVVDFFTLNFHNGSPHSWGYEVYKDGQIVFSDVGGVGNAMDGQTHSNSYSITFNPDCNSNGNDNTPYITDSEYYPHGKNTNYGAYKFNIKSSVCNF